LAIPHGDRVIELRHRFRPHLARGLYHIELWVHHNSTGTMLGHGAPVGAFRILETQTHRSIADVELKTELARQRRTHGAAIEWTGHGPDVMEQKLAGQTSRQISCRDDGIER
jgi:hypothetical protein